MKKFLALLLVLVLVLGTVAGCSSKPAAEATDNDAPASEGTDSQAPAEEETIAKEELKIALSTDITSLCLLYTSPSPRD